MNKQVKLTDPVMEGQEKTEQIEQVSQVLSIDALTSDDFKPVPVQSAKQPHPFEGYPMQKIKIGTYMDRGKEKELIINKSFIVALNPKEYVHQDPSGKGISIFTKDGVENKVDLVTAHSRVVVDEAGQNTIVVFDREIILGDGKKMTRVAICPDHTARAQLCFSVNKRSGAIEVDRRYVFADTDQVGRLRKLFNMFHYQQTQSERLAQKFEAEPESAAQ